MLMQDQQVPEEALVQCSKCSGEGSIAVDGAYTLCPRCWGEGKTDWVSNVTGSNDYRYPFGISGYSRYFSGRSGSTGYAGVQGIDGVSGPSPPIPSQSMPLLSPKLIIKYPVTNVPSPEPKPVKRDKLLKKMKDNAIQKINDFLGELK